MFVPFLFPVEIHTISFNYFTLHLCWKKSFAIFHPLYSTGSKDCIPKRASSIHGFVVINTKRSFFDSVKILINALPGIVKFHDYEDSTCF